MISGWLIIAAFVLLFMAIVGLYCRCDDRKEDIRALTWKITDLERDLSWAKERQTLEADEVHRLRDELEAKEKQLNWLRTQIIAHPGRIGELSRALKAEVEG